MTRGHIDNDLPPGGLDAGQRNQGFALRSLGGGAPPRTRFGGSESYEYARGAWYVPQIILRDAPARTPRPPGYSPLKS